MTACAFLMNVATRPPPCFFICSVTAFFTAGDTRELMSSDWRRGTVSENASQVLQRACEHVDLVLRDLLRHYGYDSLLRCHSNLLGSLLNGT